MAKIEFYASNIYHFTVACNNFKILKVQQLHFTGEVDKFLMSWREFSP